MYTAHLNLDKEIYINIEKWNIDDIIKLFLKQFMLICYVNKDKELVYNLM